MYIPKDYNRIATKRILMITAGCLLLLLSGCGQSKKEIIEQNEAFSKYISGYTSNVISTRDEIVVRLASEFKKGERPQKKLFQFEPSVAGSQVWLDERTVAFRPKEKLKSDTRYIARFNTGAFLMLAKSSKTLGLILVPFGKIWKCKSGESHLWAATVPDNS